MSDGEFQRPEYTEDDTFAFIERGRNGQLLPLEKIAQERIEQKIKHGRTIKYDYENNTNRELSTAAAGLILGEPNLFSEEWDFSICNHMLCKSYEERLVIAGALIVAELERLKFKP